METTGAKAAFEACLFAACQRCDWLLRAFVIMLGMGIHFYASKHVGDLHRGRNPAATRLLHQLEVKGKA